MQTTQIEILKKNKCLHEGRIRIRNVKFKNGTIHKKKECGFCGKHIKFVGSRKFKKKEKLQRIFEQRINTKVSAHELFSSPRRFKDSDLDKSVRRYAYDKVNDSCMSLKNKKEMISLVDYIIESYQFFSNTA